MKTEITELLSIKYPIIQGAMAWIADADLASAVSNAGGLGVIGTGTDSVDVVREKIREMKGKTDQSFGVNIFLPSESASDIVDLVIEEGVKVVTTGAGNPGKYMDRLKEAGVVVVPVVASVALAKRMQRVGASAVIVEGMEAGGHIGKQTTLALLPQVVEAVDIPVIAAGGFGNGPSLAAALMLGAQGIQVGTRFAASKESNAHEDFKKAIFKAGDIDTVTTGESVGHPVRVLRNQMTREYSEIEQEYAVTKDEALAERLEELGAGALRRAVVEGDTKKGSVMAGQIAGLIKEEESCEAIIQDYVTGAKEAFEANRKYFE